MLLDGPRRREATYWQGSDLLGFRIRLVRCRGQRSISGELTAHHRLGAQVHLNGRLILITRFASHMHD